MGDELSLSNAIVMVICTMFGYGVITMPITFLCMYWPYAIIIFIGITLIMTLTLYFICTAAYNLGNRKIDYFNVCSTIHPAVGYYIDISIIISSILSCSIYAISIFKFISIKFKMINEYFLKMMIFLILSIGPYMKNLKKLQFLSYISLGCVILLGIILFYYLLTVGVADIKSSKRNYTKCSSNLFFALCCHQGVLGIYSNLKNKNKNNILKLCMIPMASCFIIYGFVGIVGAFLFGNTRPKDQNVLESLGSDSFKKRLTNNIDNAGFLVVLALISFSIMLTSSFSFQFHPARSSAKSLLSGFISTNRLESDEMRIILSTIMLLMILIIYIITPGLDDLSRYVNGFAIVSITVILPSFAYYSTKNEKDFLSTISLILGLLGFPLIIYFLLSN